jgi:indolepyruvate ferredoxin oxidoreductase beta subunit
MTVQDAFSPRPQDPALARVIKLAILAVGGQGGGVLTNWIEEVARANDYVAQATSVAGVSQRTGATVYYIEMAPAAAHQPVFSLMPAAGDVDIMIAAELMEAGRAIIRGFVTPDRTVLIASTHRMLAVSEKIAPGDGIASADEVLAAAEIAARVVLKADFDTLAVKAGSVISASLLGALAASGTLPFPRAAFEAAIKAGGRGTEASLRAFAAGFDAVVTGSAPPPVTVKPASPVLQGPPRLMVGWQALMARVARLPEPARAMAEAGLTKVVTFQDLDYGAAYLSRLEGLAAGDGTPFAFTVAAAKYIANAMAYDDIIRVADAKTRAGRSGRIAAEMGKAEAHLMQVTEFLHPRAEELVSLMPAKIGARWAADAGRMRTLDRWFNKGRRIRTDRLMGFLTLYLLGGLTWWRPKTLRHAEEMAHLETWLAKAKAALPKNYDLAVELLRTRRLVKGYSDTHARGLSKYDRVQAGIDLVAARPDAADWARRLIEAALKDEEGKALDGALATIRSFV